MGWRSPWSATWSMVERSILSQGREYYLRAILRIYNWSTSCWIIRYAFQIIDTVQRWTSLRVPGRPWYARPCRQVRVRSRDTPGQFCHARRSSSRHRCSLHDTHSRRTFRLPRGVQKSKPSYTVISFLILDGLLFNMQSCDTYDKYVLWFKIFFLIAIR